MYIVFKQKDDVIQPLYPCNDDQESESVIADKSLCDSKDTAIFSLYAGDYKFEKSPTVITNGIYFILKIINGKADKILKASSHYYALKFIVDFLNVEINNPAIEYKVCSVSGTLIE